MPHDSAPGDPSRVGRFGTKHGGRNLNDEAAQWPTPTAGDGDSSGSRNLPGSNAKPGLSLTDATTRTPWPTPRAEDSQCAGGHRGKDDTLYGAIIRPVEGRAWPTPKAAPSGPDHAREGREGSGGDDLATIIATIIAKAPWATPKARDFRSGCTTQESIDHLTSRRVMGSNDLTNQVTASTEDRPSGALNPAWVEILMGWPVGWTDISSPCPGVWPGWPASLGPEQFDFEPPRIVEKGACPGRVARLKACGNGVVPQQAAEAFMALFGVSL